MDGSYGDVGIDHLRNRIDKLEKENANTIFNRVDKLEKEIIRLERMINRINIAQGKLANENMLHHGVYR